MRALSTKLTVFSMLLVDFFLLNKGQYDAEDLAFDNKGKYRFNGGFNVIAIPAFFVSGLVNFVVMKLFGRRSRSEASFAA